MSDFKVGDKVLVGPNFKNIAIIREIIPRVNGGLLYRIWWVTENGNEPSIISFLDSDLKTIEPEYPLSFQEALKAAIDGNVVEDSEGFVLKFDDVSCKFMYKSKNGEYENIVETFKDKSEYKYRIYEPKPKFKRGDFVVWKGEYYRIVDVYFDTDEFQYTLTNTPGNYNKSYGYWQHISESVLIFS